MKTALYKLFLIQAAYAVSLGALCGQGATGIVVAILLGTALSGLILSLRKDNAKAAVRVGLGCFLGGLFGLSCLADMILPGHCSYRCGETALSDVIGGAIGVVLGGLCVSLLYHRKRPS